MNRWQREVQQSLLDSEAEAVKELEKQYKVALKDINEKIKSFESSLSELNDALAAATDPEEIKLLQSMQRSKVYQKQYQEALKGQVSGILDKMHSDQYSTIDSYLHTCYETGYIGTMYDIAKQGIPIIQPINQAAVTKAILTDSKVKRGYYNALGVNVDHLKKVITHEISRGIASGLRYGEIARNIDNAAKTGFYNAYRIARTEGHRIQQSAAYDAQTAIKAKGIDILRQWDAVLDGRTRPTHRMLDGQIVGVDEPFDAGGTEVMKPGDFGIAEEDINCRCIVTTRIPEDLDEEELKTLKDRAEFFGLDKTKNLEDFRVKYAKAAKSVTSQATSQQASISGAKDFDALDNYLQSTYNISMNQSVKSLDFDNVKMALEGVERAFQDLPEIGSSVTTITTSNSGVMSCDGKTIFFNPSDFTDHNTMLDLCKQYDGGWWVKNVSPASIGYHECTHAFEQVLIDANTSYTSNVERIIAWNKCTEAQAIVSEACKSIKKTPYGKGKRNDELKAAISRYAKTTASETMAEAHADVYANGSNANPLSLEIQRLTIERYKSLKGIQP